MTTNNCKPFIPIPLPKEFEERLRCSSCSHLISWGHFLKATTGHQCPRCSNNTYEGSCSLYEVVARSFLFPCKNRKCGCRVLLPFGDKMKHHEENCQKKGYCCPVAKTLGCNWRGDCSGIKEHFEKEHGNFVLRDVRVEVDIKTTTEERFVYFFQDKPLLLVDLRYCSKSKGLSVQLMEVVENRMESFTISREYTITVHSPANDATINFTRKMGAFFLDNSSTRVAKNKVIDTTLLEWVKEQDQRVKIVFHLQPASPKTTLFPFPNTNQVYPCKNRVYGCDFAGIEEWRQQHESTCFALACPLEPKLCAWKGLMRSFGSHCEGKHVVAQDWLTVDLNALQISGETTLSALLRWNGEHFRVCLGLVEKFGLRYVDVAVQYVGEPSRAGGFRCILKFGGASAASESAFKCQPYLNGGNYFECCSFEWDSVTRSKLTIRIRPHL